MATKRIKFIRDKGFALKGYITEMAADRAKALIDAGYAVELKAVEFDTETKVISTKLAKKGN